MRKILIILTLIGLAVAGPGKDASAAWLVNGTWFSNICRANANPNYYWAYPPQDAEPVGEPCSFPDGTPGTVTPN